MRKLVLAALMALLLGLTAAVATGGDDLPGGGNRYLIAGDDLPGGG